MVKPTRRSNRRRLALTLPELEHSKDAVLNSLGSLQSRRSYKHAIDEFICWYCSEPRLALNRAVVLRYRLHLENIPLAPSTINVRLAAIRRIAYEAAETGLLSPELVAGIRRVKGIKRLGQPVGNWLTAQQGRQLLSTSEGESPRGVAAVHVYATAQVESWSRFSFSSGISLCRPRNATSGASNS